LLFTLKICSEPRIVLSIEGMFIDS
jgi:hypothetical protein